ncbi:MAG: IPTL-CTERM sorting domain-containing protein [Xanthomonadales bacterium]
MKAMLVMLLTTLSASLAAAPFGYSITADSNSDFIQSLFRIDLATGAETRIGAVKLPFAGQAKLDVEGLAFAPDGTLYGVDDESMTLFPLDPSTGQVQSSDEVPISVLLPGGNDFGMTFACDDNLYLSSVTEGSLYRLSLNGTPDPIGPLGVNISALAAFGNPVKLYGLGNGTLDDKGTVDSPNLYEINLTTGAANKIGSGLGAAAGRYKEGGLAFDDIGQLWAILESHEDLSPFAPSPSRIVKINTTTGVASDAQFASEAGYESLAITIPRGCSPVPNGDLTVFTVQKRFVDGNNITPVQLNISCNDGLPLNSSLTVLPNEGVFGDFEVTFIVEKFTDGELDCEIWEDTPAGYTATYQCQAEANCTAGEDSGPCAFQGVGIGENNLCLIQNHVDPVAFTVNKQWLFASSDVDIEDTARISLFCNNVTDGDGEYNQGSMSWSWDFEIDNAQQTATVYPNFDGSTRCWAVEKAIDSAVESDHGCADPVTVLVGDGPHSCTVINTVFYEGIPTLNQYGLLLFSALMLLTGMAATRRF